VRCNNLRIERLLAQHAFPTTIIVARKAGDACANRLSSATQPAGDKRGMIARNRKTRWKTVRQIKGLYFTLRKT
jgi:hypothetical protein